MKTQLLAALIAPAIAFGSHAALAQDQHRGDPQQGARQASEGHFLERGPDRAISADDIIGKDIYSQLDRDDAIGTVHDLVISDEGEVVAVLIDAGGFLGIGSREVALNWERIERRSAQDRNEFWGGDDTDYDLYVEMTEDQLRNAPEYRN